MDKKKLLKYAVDYLSKYDSSKKNLEDILKRKIFRLKISRLDKNKLLDYLKEIINQLEKNNLVNDKRYSLTKISSLSRVGRSKNYIHNYLLKKGIEKSLIQYNFEKFQEDNSNWELNSAKKFAQKKKLLTSDDTYEKKLAKMARAGFSYEICKKILS